MRLLKGLAAAAILAITLPGVASAQATADLSVSLVGRPEPGGVTWTITVKNLGPGQATGVRLEAFYGSDAVPESATTTQGACRRGASTVDFSLGTISPGGQATTTVVLTAFGGDGGALDVTATSTTKDPRLKNNRVRENVEIPSPADSLQPSGTFCPPSGGVATGGGGTAADSQAWLTAVGLLAVVGVVAAGVVRLRR